MDRLALQKMVSAFFDKYKYVLLVVVLGLLLMLWPTGKKETQSVQLPAQPVQQPSITEELSNPVHKPITRRTSPALRTPTAALRTAERW